MQLVYDIKSQRFRGYSLLLYDYCLLTLDSRKHLVVFISLSLFFTLFSLLSLFYLCLAFTRSPPHTCPSTNLPRLPLHHLPCHPHLPLDMSFQVNSTPEYSLAPLLSLRLKELLPLGYGIRQHNLDWLCLPLLRIY